MKCLSWSPCLLHLPSRTEPETDLAALLAEYSVKAERSSQRSLSLLSFRVLDQKEQPGVERHLERQAEGLPTALYVLERKEKYIHSKKGELGILNVRYVHTWATGGMGGMPLP